MTLLKDRRQAGRLLVGRCSAYADREDVVLLAKPPGGIPVGYEIAHALHAPLDVISVRNLGVPGMRDAVMGSVTTGGMRMVNEDIVRLLGISQFVIDTVAAEEQTRMQHSEERYREGWPALPIRDRTSLVVTDGIATGASMKAAVTALRKRGASRVVVCAPVASREGLDRVEAIADEVVCLDTPDPFISVTRWYEDASPPGDEECTALLKKSSLDLCRRPGRHTVH